jgi:capsular polysaccharide biosynthesis protein
MNIISFKNNNMHILKEEDENGRVIGYNEYNEIQMIGRNSLYPNILLYNKKDIITPYDEKIMSLNKDTFYNDNIYNNKIVKLENKNVIENRVFFFIYNFDNYYHFIYDTLPYLYTYLELKKKYPDMKLLVNYPNKDKKCFYKFNTDFLYKLVDKNEIIIHNKNNIYSKIIISTSLTHGGLSNHPPREEIYEIYKLLQNNININNIDDKYKNHKNLKNIYISRRTWLNKDKSNIGTDYTSRRKMVNENELVEKLKQFDFVEIFSENLNSDEKLFLFANAEKICGSIGGGMANLLFSKKQTMSYVIVSPFFLDINSRFKYSLENTDIKYFDETEILKKENSKYSLYVRVKIINREHEHYNKIGEIINFINNKYEVALSNNDIVGFNNQSKYESILFYDSEFAVLDQGLNSPHIYDFNTLIDSLIN